MAAGSSTITRLPSTAGRGPTGKLFLLGVAYDDPSGLTAEFNRNALRVLARELGGTIDDRCFEHMSPAGIR